MAAYKVVMTDKRHGSYEIEKDILRSIDAEVVIENCETADDVIKVCRDADGIMADLAPMTDEVIEKLERCRVIARYGVGYDSVNVDAATKKGIYVTNVTGYCSEEVSDHALALLMACVRKIALVDKGVREGSWNIAKNLPVNRMAGKTFTLLGFGDIARCLNRKLKGFGFSRILVYDPYVDSETIEKEGAQKADWETAVSEADYISVHIPLNPKTEGVINKSTFELMKPGAILINTSRGAVIDQEALIQALKQNIIRGAGLDVYSSEPLEDDSPLKKMQNCVLTDHMGFYSEEAIRDLKKGVAENVKAVLLGKEPVNPVNSIVIESE